MTRSCMIFHGSWMIVGKMLNLGVVAGVGPGFLERGGCLLFLNSITGKIITEKSNYKGSCNPHNPSPKSASE